MRAEPSDKTELVTQILFGELFEILEEQPKWLKVNHLPDNYIGWIDRLQATIVPEEFANKYLTTTLSHAINFDKTASIGQGNSLPIGAVLPFWQEGALEVIISEKKISVQTQQQVSLSKPVPSPEIISYALSLLGTPYLWGGRSNWGIDCSGFTQLAYKLSGYHLLRDASQQVTQEGTKIDWDDQQPSDLAFFEREGKIVHVGIILENQKIIHASGWVRIDRLDQTGIWMEDYKMYSHHLHSIRRTKNILEGYTII